MTTYKIHYGPDGNIKGYGPNKDYYQPYMDDGDIIELSDTLPEPKEAELYERLRLEAERRLTSTDKYATVDYPNSALRDTVLAYRAELRGINRQPGAPWDGGGPATPWPTKPEV